MDHGQRIEQALEAALNRADTEETPPLLAKAVRHAVFPGGARVRPRLTLAVAAACGDDAPSIAEACAAAVEFFHCASLAHDDLPCFDNATERRGRPSVHAAFGAPLAVLAGDALIVLAFETVSRAALSHPHRAGALIAAFGRGVGMMGGICAGQAWESEPSPALDRYHRAKTGALFVAAVTGGAIAAGADPGPWRALGEGLGEAYQVADDLMDALSTEGAEGKPIGQDSLHGRPNAVTTLGVAGAVARLELLVARAAASIPPCAGAADLRELVRLQATRLVPKQIARSAA